MSRRDTALRPWGRGQAADDTVVAEQQRLRSAFDESFRETWGDLEWGTRQEGWDLAQRTVTPRPAADPYWPEPNHWSGRR